MPIAPIAKAPKDSETSRAKRDSNRRFMGQVLQRWKGSECKSFSENKGKPKSEQKARVKGKAKEPAVKKLDTPAAEEGDKVEEDAARKLSFAKALVEAGKVEKAQIRLRDIVAGFPKTKAAREARALLEKLEK